VPGRRRWLSGPSFAAEVAARSRRRSSRRPSHERGVIAQETLSSTTFRVYTHDDVIGVELAAR
jgi:glycerol-3-phosphate dehydrogenase